MGNLTESRQTLLCSALWADSPVRESDCDGPSVYLTSFPADKSNNVLNGKIYLAPVTST